MANSRQRSIITPEHFVVAPEILGMPLASPSRRAYAMAIDLVLAAILVKAGGLFLALAAAFLLFRASAPGAQATFVKRSVRNLLRLLGAILLFLVIRNAWHNISKRFENKEPQEAPEENVSGDVNFNLSPGQVAALATPMLTLRTSDDTAAVREAAAKVFLAMKSAGATRTEMRESRAGVVSIMGNNSDSAKLVAVDRALIAVAGKPKPPVPADALMRDYLAAAEKNDTNATTMYRDSIKAAVAGGDLKEMRERVDALARDNEKLKNRLEKSKEEHGIRTALAGFAVDDLGVGFGWFAVYFTASLALWRGQTAGKRIAGIRVLRLDGEPLGWWMSFERFGGYAASFSVGLLGFLQILWDKNRQGLHDKACETVVVREKK